MDQSSLYLILALTIFVFMAVLLIHHHNCMDQVKRKQGKVDGITNQLTPRIAILEKEIAELKAKNEELDAEISTLQ
ncbi:hypothetical protein [Pseudodesulfovibrio sp.]|uniref:hypothetical protein n=1 Tax=unclassified Pseudodesulfovibrio TaxID=2661612 RepID=UPI003B00634D